MFVTETRSKWDYFHMIILMGFEYTVQLFACHILQKNKWWTEEKASFNRGHNGIDVPVDKCLFSLFCNCNFRHYSIHIRIEEPNPIHPNGVRTPTQKSTPHFKNYSVCDKKCMHDAIGRLMSTRASLEFSHTARFWFCSVFNYISTRKNTFQWNWMRWWTIQSDIH